MDYQPLTEEFGFKGGHSIEESKKNGILECIILKAELKMTRNDCEFMSLWITDGVDDTYLQVWESEFADHSPDYFEIGVALNVRIKWNETYRSFAAFRDYPIIKIPHKIEREDVLCYQSSEEIFPYLGPEFLTEFNI